VSSTETADRKNGNRPTNQAAPWVLGISASHNGAVCLLKGHDLVVSIQEERLVRKKRRKIYGAQHSLSLEYCLDYAGIKPHDLSMVVLSVTGDSRSPMHDLKLNKYLQVEQNGIETLVVGHHFGHAVSAFATSGFDESAVLVVDGIGSTLKDLSKEEVAVIKGPVTAGWESVSLYTAAGVTTTPLEKHMTDGYDWFTLNGPGMSKFRSLGTLFSTIAEQIFDESLDAGKVMGLAPYGVADIPCEDFFEIIDGQFVFHDLVPARFQHRKRWPRCQTEYKNLAASVQAALEDALLYLVNHLYELCSSKNLCYAGGVALNSVANERVIRETPFENVYIIPAAEDSGVAIGAAYYGLWQLLKKNEKRRLLHDAVGREYEPAEIASAIAVTPGVEIVESHDVISDTVELLCAGKNIGWFQGRSELGPRALGQRSILCDPRRPDAKDVLNGEVKFREAFRPFAPVIILEEAGNWFEWDGFTQESPYMLRVANFRPEKRALVPAVVHIDGTGRVQTLSEAANGIFYQLVKKFYKKTGVPILLNTSFNIMGRPIVETPQDALLSLLVTGLDYCVLGNQIVKKRDKILLGIGEFHDWKSVSQELLRLDEVDTNETSRLATPQNCAGIYRHLSDVLTIEPEGSELRGTFKGIASTLKPEPQPALFSSGDLFRGSTIAFLKNAAGEIDRLVVKVPAGTEWDGVVLSKPASALFTRALEQVKSDHTFARKCTGEYQNHIDVLRVTLRSENKLVVTCAGQPEYELLEGKDRIFYLRNTPGYSLEFKVDERGFVSEALLSQPNGISRLKHI
jgi:carbamoyltransferase